jgi:hypothetical protein
MSHLRLPLIGIAVAVAGAIAPAVASAQTTLDQLQVPSPVAAYAGTSMWSQYDASTGMFQLVRSAGGGAPAPVGVPERSTPFDVDLGTSSSGATYAVYTRNGAIYRLRDGTSSEQKLSSKLGSSSQPSRNPTIQKGQIAFIRRSGGQDQLRFAKSSSATPKTLVSAKSIASAELGGKQVAYVVESAGKYGFGAAAVHIRNLSSGHDQTVFSVNAGGASSNDVTKPSFTNDGKSFVWAHVRNAAPGNQLVKYTLSSGKLTYAADRRNVVSSAWAGTSLGMLTSTSLDGDVLSTTPPAAEVKPGALCSDNGTAYCSVQLSGPVTFSASSSTS